MNGLRRLAATHRSLATLIVAAALLLRLLVPAGFMPMVADGRIAIVVCSGSQPAVAMAGMPHSAMPEHGRTAPDQHGENRPDAPCAFAGLAMPTLPGADPALLMLAILFVMLLAVRSPARLHLAIAVRLRPPLRAPPAG